MDLLLDRSDPEAVFVLAYVSRWPAVDRALHDAIAASAMAATPVDIPSLLPPSEAGAVPPGSELLLLRRAGGAEGGGLRGAEGVARVARQGHLSTVFTDLRASRERTRESSLACTHLHHAERPQRAEQRE